MYARCLDVRGKGALCLQQCPRWRYWVDSMRGGWPSVIAHLGENPHWNEAERQGEVVGAGAHAGGGVRSWLCVTWRGVPFRGLRSAPEK